MWCALIRLSDVMPKGRKAGGAKGGSGGKAGGGAKGGIGSGKQKGKGGKRKSYHERERDMFNNKILVVSSCNLYMITSS